MTEHEIIKNKVKEFITNQKMFTSVNLTNAIKKDGIWINNSGVAEWLRNNFEEVNEELGDSYHSSLILVMNDSRKANLYYPFFADPNNFNDRNTDALTPDEFQALHGYSFTDAKAKPQSKAAGNTVAPAVASVTNVNLASVPQTSKTVAPINFPARTITEKSKDRIRIPGAFIKALGLNPGDNVAASQKIKIPNLSKNIKVQSDYRVSILRSSLSLGKGPVRMFIKDGSLTIEKV